MTPIFRLLLILGTISAAHAQIVVPPAESIREENSAIRAWDVTSVVNLSCGLQASHGPEVLPCPPLQQAGIRATPAHQNALEEHFSEHARLPSAPNQCSKYQNNEKAQAFCPVAAETHLQGTGHTAYERFARAASQVARCLVRLPKFCHFTGIRATPVDQNALGATDSCKHTLGAGTTPQSGIIKSHFCSQEAFCPPLDVSWNGEFSRKLCQHARRKSQKSHNIPQGQALGTNQCYARAASQVASCPVPPPKFCQVTGIRATPVDQNALGATASCEHTSGAGTSLQFGITQTSQFSQEAFCPTLDESWKANLSWKICQQARRKSQQLQNNPQGQTPDMYQRYARATSQAASCPECLPTHCQSTGIRATPVNQNALGATDSRESTPGMGITPQFCITKSHQCPHKAFCPILVEPWQAESSRKISKQARENPHLLEDHSIHCQPWVRISQIIIERCCPMQRECTSPQANCATFGAYPSDATSLATQQGLVSGANQATVGAISNHQFCVQATGIRATPVYQNALNDLSLSTTMHIDQGQPPGCLSVGGHYTATQQICMSSERLKSHEHNMHNFAPSIDTSRDARCNTQCQHEASSDQVAHRTTPSQGLKKQSEWGPKGNSNSQRSGRKNLEEKKSGVTQKQPASGPLEPDKRKIKQPASGTQAPDKNRQNQPAVGTQGPCVGSTSAWTQPVGKVHINLTMPPVCVRSIVQPEQCHVGVLVQVTQFQNHPWPVEPGPATDSHYGFPATVEVRQHNLALSQSSGDHLQYVHISRSGIRATPEHQNALSTRNPQQVTQVKIVPIKILTTTKVEMELESDNSVFLAAGPQIRRGYNLNIITDRQLVVQSDEEFADDEDAESSSSVEDLNWKEFYIYTVHQPPAHRSLNMVSMPLQHYQTATALRWTREQLVARYEVNPTPDDLDQSRMGGMLARYCDDPEEPLRMALIDVEFHPPAPSWEAEIIRSAMFLPATLTNHEFLESMHLMPYCRYAHRPCFLQVGGRTCSLDTPAQLIIHNGEYLRVILPPPNEDK